MILRISSIYFYAACMTVIFIALSMKGEAQDIPFIPPVYNYTTGNYKAGNQNWAIAQGKNGEIYFGNNNGLLSFDGVNWNLHKLPNNLSVKSIFLDHDSSTERIYVGSFEEFGYFERNHTNQLIYHSLTSLVEGYEFHNDEIWKICLFGNKIYFQSFSAFFVLDNKKIRTFRPNPGVLYFFPAGNRMFAQLINSDFSRFDGEMFHPVVQREQLNNDNVVAVLPFGEEYLLVTSKNGFYIYSEDDDTLIPWKTAIELDLQQAIVNRAIFSGGSQYVLGTLNNGMFVINHKGEKLWHINRKNGLNNNTILALFSDRDNSIWAAMDNGISNIRTTSPFSFFEPTDIQIGLVEDILTFNDRLYLATNQGVYNYSEREEKIFRLTGFDNQSWFIKSFGNQVFVGHNLGTSLLENDREVPIPGARTGGMDMIETTLNGNNILLESTYTALYIYSQDSSGKWVFSHQIKGFSDLIKNIEIDHTGNIWAGHMYKGVYRIKLKNDLSRVAEIENYLSLDSTQLTTLRPVKVMKLKGRIVFADGHSFFTYDDIQQKIVPFKLLNDDLPGFADSYRIVPVNDDLFWFIRNTEYALVEFIQHRYRLRDRIPYSILNNPPNEGRANIYVADDSISYFCLNGGIGRYRFTEDILQETSDLQISSVAYYDRKNDRTFFLDAGKKGVIEYKNNDIVFQFSHPEFSKKIFRVECYLHGYDNRWVTADENLSISYNNLPADEYILKARVLDNSGNELSAVSFSFRIKNPWYKTWWSILTYITIILLLSGWIIKNHIQKIIHKKNQLFIEQENRRLAQLERQEKEITSLRNEKLESELTFKSKELASATMLIINHSEFLRNLRSTIQNQILAGKINRAQGNELVNMIGNSLSDEDEWKLFQDNFDLIHQNFFRKLKERYPTLTPTDLKLCALLRLNYSSKEVSSMLNISIRGVEAARYRLRKKINLTEAVNLVDFMIKFQ